MTQAQFQPQMQPQPVTQLPVIPQAPVTMQPVMVPGYYPQIGTGYPYPQVQQYVAPNVQGYSVTPEVRPFVPQPTQVQPSSVPTPSANQDEERIQARARLYEPLGQHPLTGERLLSVHEILQEYGRTEDGNTSITLALINLYEAGLTVELEAIKAFKVGQEAIEKLKEAYELLNQYEQGDATGMGNKIRELSQLVEQQHQELMNVMHFLHDANKLADYFQRLEFELAELPEVQEFRNAYPQATFEQFKEARLAKVRQAQPKLPMPVQAGSVSNGQSPDWLALRQRPFYEYFK